MASESVPGPVPAPLRPWLGRLGLSGTLLVMGGLLGLIVAFFPLVSVWVKSPVLNHGIPEVADVRVQTKVMHDWRGKVCLASYLAAVVLAFVLYPPNGLGWKALGWVGAGVGLLVVTVALWLLVLTLDTDSANLMGMGSVKAQAEIGAYLNVVAGAMVAAGGLLKAREEKLI